jgi:eukaryotic-like serine/threonine-protein kinase
MKAAAVADLVTLLWDEALLPAAARAERAAAGRFTDARDLARHLVQRGWLTPWQANQLILGRGRELLLGRYVLLERVGQGGMGQVFKARHRLLERTDAVKVIHPKIVSQPHAVQRFLREAKATARLSHPHLITVHDAGENGGRYYMAMEFVPGTDLAKLVGRLGPLPWPQVSRILHQAALGLQHAHERGLVHRDLKPSNLLLTEATGQVKILDLGLARILEDADIGTADRLTSERVIMGTPDYMAPEQALDTHRVDIRADLYSLGCTAYHLLAGQVPFPGGANVEKLLRHQLEQPRPLEQLRPDLPPGLLDTVRRLLEKDPAQRYQTPTELAQALVSLFAAGPAGAATEAHRPSAGEAAPAPCAPGPAGAASAAPAHTGGAPALPSLLPLPAIPALPSTGVALDTGQAGSLRHGLSAGAPEPEPGTAIRAEAQPTLPAPRWRRASRVAVAGLGGLVVVTIVLLTRGWFSGGSAPPDPGGAENQGSVPLGGKPIVAAQSWSLDWKAGPTLGPPADLVQAGALFGVALSPDGKRVAMTGGNYDHLTQPGFVLLVEWGSGNWQLLGNPRHAGSRVAFSPDGKTLVSVTGDVTDQRAPVAGDVTFWEVAPRKERKTVPALPGGIHQLAMAPGGKWVAVAGVNAGLKLLDLPAGQDRGNVEHLGKRDFTALAVSPDGLFLALGDVDGALEVSETAGKAGRCRIPPPPKKVAALSGLAFRPGGAEVVGTTGVPAGQSAEIRGWDVTNKQLKWFVRCGDSHIFAMALAPDGRTLATGDQDGYVQLWDLETRKKLQSWKGHSSAVYAVDFDGAGTTLASASADGKVRIWLGR